VLFRVGQQRTAFIYHLHDILCDPTEARICHSCAQLPLEWLGPVITTTDKPATIKEVRWLLSALKGFDGINFYTLDEKDLHSLTGLTRSNLHDVAETAQVEFLNVCRVFVYLRLGIAQHPVAVLFGIARSTLSEQLKRDIALISEAMSRKHLRRSRADIEKNAIPFVRKFFPTGCVA
jgi:hypothetical protein